MPRRSTVTEIRLNNLVTVLTSVTTLLNTLSDACGAPFVQAISNTMLSLVTAAQNVKRNKEQCIQLMEDIQGLLFAIVNLHTNSEPMGTLPPAALEHIAKFTEYVLFLGLATDLDYGLQQALQVFKVETDLYMLNSIAEMQDRIKNMHQQLLERISTLSEDSVSSV
ncbi:hypothetical protein C8R44DRAFT_895197 [Mycena epipterygia]|nr:hypothetical protein C8R44DRAFT_895197 [Mycena epipterygia]